VKIFIFCLPFQRALPLNISLENDEGEVEEPESEPECPGSATPITSSCTKDLEIGKLKSQVSSHHKEKIKFVKIIFPSQVSPFNFFADLTKIGLKNKCANLFSVDMSIYCCILQILENKVWQLNFSSAFRKLLHQVSKEVLNDYLQRDLTTQERAIVKVSTLYCLNNMNTLDT
jgi:hypothetical protein